MLFICCVGGEGGAAMGVEDVSSTIIRLRMKKIRFSITVRKRLFLGKKKEEGFSSCMNQFNHINYKLKPKISFS